MRVEDYLDDLRTLVNLRAYRAARAFAEANDPVLDRELTARELGALSALMEHANLGESVEVERG